MPDPRPARPALGSAGVLLALLLAALPLSAKPPQAGSLGDFSAFSVGSPQTGLTIKPVTVIANGKAHRYKAEVAQTPQQQAIGMMFRKSMPQDSGMLFPMQPTRPASFYMRNTYLPLDIIFIGPDNRVLNIAANTTPLSEALVSSDGPVAAVLELKAGEAKRIGLKPGDSIRW